MLSVAKLMMPGGTGGGGTETLDLPYLIFNTVGQRSRSRYFNTGIVPGANTRVELLMGRNPSAALDIGCQFGCRAGWVSKALMLNYGPVRGRCWIIYGDGTYGLDVQPADPEYSAVLVSFGADGTMSAGDQVLASGQALSLANNAFYIGDVNENGRPKGSSDSQGSAKMYWCKMYEGSTLVKHYVPAQQNGEAVLHELVSDSYLSSTGSTSSFAASTIAYGTETVTVVNGGRIEMETTS